MLESPNCPFGNATEAEGQQGIGDAKQAAEVDPGVVGHLRGPPRRATVTVSTD